MLDSLGLTLQFEKSLCGISFVPLFLPILVQNRQDKLRSDSLTINLGGV